MTALTTTETSAVATADSKMSAVSLMMDPSMIDRIDRVALIMASGKTTVPKHLAGNHGDCFAVTMQAMQWNMNPFAVAQKTHLVNGTLGYEGQLVGAVLNNSPALKDRLNFEWFGPWEKIVGRFAVKKNAEGKEYRVPGWTLHDEEGCGVRVWATLQGESSPRELTVLMAQARTRNSGLWADDPRQQIAYLAERKWGRLYAPDVMLGVYTADELEIMPPINMGPAEIVQPPAAESPLIAKSKAAAESGMTAYQEFFKALTPAQRKEIAGQHDANKTRAAAVDAARTVDQAPAPFPPAEQKAPHEDPALPVTFESVLKRLNDAKTEDAMYVAMDWANELTDQGQIKELEARFNARLAEMRGGK